MGNTQVTTQQQINPRDPLRQSKLSKAALSQLGSSSQAASSMYGLGYNPNSSRGANDSSTINHTSNSQKFQSIGSTGGPWLYIEDPDLTMQNSILKNLELKDEDIFNDILKTVFDGDSEALQADLMLIQARQDPQHYDHSVMVVFWFAIHIENLEIAHYLVQNEISVKQLVACLYHKEFIQAEDLEKLNSQGHITTSKNFVSSSRRPAPPHNPEYGEEIESSHEFSDDPEGEKLPDYQVSSYFSKSASSGSHEGQNNKRPIYEYEGGESVKEDRKQEVASSRHDNRSPAQRQILTAAQQKSIKQQSFSSKSAVSPMSAIVKNSIANHPGNQILGLPRVIQTIREDNTFDNQSKDPNLKDEKEPLEKPMQALAHALNELKKLKEKEAKVQDKEKKDDNKMDMSLESFGISSEQLASTDIRTADDLQIVKHYLKTDSYVVMSKILKVLLQMDEVKLASILTLDYEIILDEEMLFNAVEKEDDQFQWLFFLWATRKNYLGNRNDPTPTFITFDQLFDIIIRHFSAKPEQTDNDSHRYIKQVLDWRITCSENINNNIIRCLLVHHLDEIAVEYMGVYNKLLNKDLLIYCIEHGNHYFLQRALVLAAFDKMLFREETVIGEILTILKRGYCTNFILNIISLIDISLWKNQRLQSLIEILNDYVLNDYGQNKLLLSPNPLMSMTLACEILGKIADARRKFEIECFEIRQNILLLGQMYSKKIGDEEFYERIIMSKDFTNRSVIKIITQNNFEALMDEMDPKAERVMGMIWLGKEAALCDGDIWGYSNFVHIIYSKTKKVNERREGGTTMMQIITNFFQFNRKLNYGFQYRFRTQSIQFYFMKEFICAFIMLIIFQYINLRYLELFSKQTLGVLSATVPDPSFTIDTNGTTPMNTTTAISMSQKLSKVHNSIEQYVQWNVWALLFSTALVFQHALKLWFNIFSDLKIGMDKWTVLDTVSALLNVVAVVLIKQLDPNIFLTSKKEFVDYYMLLVLIVSWLRFFSYFLVWRAISKLLLTLIRMLGDTLVFLFLVSCFILIMSSVFATLYQDNDPAGYGGLAITVTTLFNGVVAQYSYDDDQMQGRIISHSILMIFHVCFTNIILLNYLIAILSSTYGAMRVSGTFSFKVNLYQYCERYMNAFKDRAYGELVMHPPPLSYLGIFLLPFSFSRTAMVKASKAMSYVIFWIENVAYILVFTISELIMSPVAYAKIWWNMFQMLRESIHEVERGSVYSFIRSVAYCILWFFTGPIILSWILLLDLGNFLVILMHHDGFILTQEQKKAENKVDDQLKIQIYNDIRAIVISWFLKIVKYREKEIQQSMDSRAWGGSAVLQKENSSDDDDLDRIPDFFIIEEHYQQLRHSHPMEDQLQSFLINMVLISDEWKKRRTLKERRLRKEQIDNSSSNDAKIIQVRAKMRKSLKRTIKNYQQGVDFNQLRGRRMSVFPIGWEKHQINAASQKKQATSIDLSTNIKTAVLHNLQMGIMEQDKMVDGIDMSDFKIPDEEEKLVEEFLQSFVIDAENGLKGQIDIRLMIQALPNKIMSFSLETVDLFNLRIFQEALHGYQNLDVIKAQEYFDEKKKQKVQIVKQKLTSQREVIDDAFQLLELIKTTLDNKQEQQKQYSQAPIIETN